MALRIMACWVRMRWHAWVKRVWPGHLTKSFAPVVGTADGVGSQEGEGKRNMVILRLLLPTWKIPGSPYRHPASPELARALSHVLHPGPIQVLRCRSPILSYPQSTRSHCLRKALTPENHEDAERAVRQPYSLLPPHREAL